MLVGQITTLIVKEDIPQRSGLTMFVRDFQALGIAASRFSQGYLVIWEAVERIEGLQMPLNYLGSAMMRHAYDERRRDL